MNKFTTALIVCLSTFSLAQVSGSGTAGTVPLWTDSVTIGDSLINQLSVDPVEGFPTESCGTVPDATLSNMCFYQTHNAFSAGLDAYTHDTSNNHLGRAASINLFKSKGTQFVPGAVITGDALGNLTFNGFDGTSYGPKGAGSRITSTAIENWVAGSHGSSVEILATPSTRTVALSVVIFKGLTGPITTSAAFTGTIAPGSYLVSNLPAAAPGNAAQMIAVHDSTAITSEGQTCVGGGTDTALAFSNGVTWKCF